jgi:hypothetical protein
MKRLWIATVVATLPDHGTARRRANVDTPASTR